MDLALVGLAVDGIENHSLARLGAAARSAGYEARVVPFLGFAELERALADVVALRPRVVGVSLQTSESALAAACFTKLLRERGCAARVVLGGHFASLHAEELLALDAGIDAVVRLAGERAIVGLLAGESDARIPGLVWKDADGIHVGAPAEAVTDVLAPPRDGALPLHLGVPHADLVVSRGCEHTCAYCCIPGASALAASEARRAGAPRPQEARYTQSTAEAVAREMARLFHERGARAFTFMDDNLLPDGPRAIEDFARTVRQALDAERVPAVAVSLQLRADGVDEGAADALAALGLARAYVGVDGYSPEQLRVLGRRSPATAGPRALELLAARGVFSVVNALVVGPTVPLVSLEAEVDALAAVRRAPVHLLPVEVRRGSALFTRAERLGLVEGSFLHRGYRFIDERTHRVARVLLALPTRLRERSLPVAMYDLAHNVGIASRLLPDFDVTSYRASYDRLAAAWNEDQARVLRAAIAASRDGDAAVDELIAAELPRVTAFDRALIAEADSLVTRVERDASRTLRRPAQAHMRSQVLGAVAFSMSLVACSASTDGDAGADMGTDGAASDALAHDAAIDDAAVSDASIDDGIVCDDPARMAWPGVTSDVMGYVEGCSTFRPPSRVLAHIDAHGQVTSFEGIGADGGVIILPPDVVSCLDSFFAGACYPSAAGGTAEFVPHLWLA